MGKIEIETLKGNKYIYNSDYNIIQAADMYDEKVLEVIAKSNLIRHDEITYGSFVNDPRQCLFTQMCFVMTDQCNFRCNYCVNSEQYSFSKGLKNKEITKDIINDGLELYVKNYNRSVQLNPNISFIISFYGGEPLLKYDLIWYTIERVKNHYKIDDAIFTLTTNGYLLTKEMAEYLSKNNVHINISLDGYQEYHDLNRRTIDNKPTFEKVYNNFIQALAVETIGKFSILLTHDMRFSPIKMYEFFLENRVLDDHLMRVNSVVEINTSYYCHHKAYSNYWREFEELFQIYILQRKGNIETKVNFINKYFDGLLLDISKRLHFNDNLFSVCSPLKSKIAVSTDGRLHICEKMNENYSIGDVKTGINYEYAYKYYSNLCNIRKNVCYNCVIRNLCNVCYVHIQCDGSEMKVSESYCEKARKGAKEALKYYCSTLDC